MNSTRIEAMNRTLRLLFSSAVLAALITTAPAAAQDPPAIAFVGATVLPMDGERSLPNHTVVVRGDRIVAVGPAGIQVPANARRIEAAGKFIIPGLADTSRSSVSWLSAEVAARAVRIWYARP